MAAANDKADGVLASALARAREETALVAEEFARASAHLTAAEEECARVKEQCEILREECAREREAAISSATQASEASMQRFQLEEENGVLLEDLIEAKMKCALFAEEAENEKETFYS